MKTQKILLPHGALNRLAADCGVSPGTVREALRFASDTETQCLIRKRALELYGGQVVELDRRL